jgi:hypothetical protein
MVRTSAFIPARVALALGAVILSTSLAACAAPLSNSGSSARGGSGTTRAGSSDLVLVCDSGTSSSGGVATSSAVAVRVPAGTPVPPGCRVG